MSLLPALVAGGAFAQTSEIIAFDRDGTLWWTNAVTNVYYGLQGAMAVDGCWQDDSGSWNAIASQHVMSAPIPIEEIEGSPFFFRVLTSSNLLPRNGIDETYDVWSNGIPQFIETDYINLREIRRLSRFRSAAGHDNSDDFESCRSMKHYFVPQDVVDWTNICITAPASGTVHSIFWEEVGAQLRIRSADYGAICVVVYHVTPCNTLAVGQSVDAGEAIGRHASTDTVSDIEVGISTTGGWMNVSYFDVMPDVLFSNYVDRGLTSRTDVIISKEERDADPLTCIDGEFQSPGSLPNWVDLN